MYTAFPNAMNSFRSPSLLSLACAILLAGCSTSGSVASWNGQKAPNGNRVASSGWGGALNPRSTSPREEPAATTRSVPEDACYVQAPHIPAATGTVQVMKRPERQVTGTDIIIPAEFVSVPSFEGDDEGFAWLPSVCENNVERHLVQRIQQALVDRGYDVGAVDGIAGPATKAGLEYYKRDNGLYGDGYTYQALESLGIDPQTIGPGFAKARPVAREIEPSHAAQ